jgi:hypothetical protein
MQPHKKVRSALLHYCIADFGTAFDHHALRMIKKKLSLLDGTNEKHHHYSC